MTKALILDANRLGSNMRKEVKDAIFKQNVKILLYKNGQLEKELKGIENLVESAI